MKVQAYSLCALTSCFPRFEAAVFLRVASVSIDLVGFTFTIQTRGSSQGTLPSVFSLVMHEYARG